MANLPATQQSGGGCRDCVALGKPVEKSGEEKLKITGRIFSKVSSFRQKMVILRQPRRSSDRRAGLMWE